MNKTIIFDMDGTIVDFYGVDQWLDKIRNDDVSPYMVAKPIYDSQELIEVLRQKKKQGYRLEVSTWLSKNASVKFSEQIKVAKREWLKNHKLLSLFSSITFLNYGESKLKNGAVIVDDNDTILNEFKSKGLVAIDAKKNIIEQLKRLR